MRTNKIWTETDIKRLVSSNERAAMRAVLALYKRQTEDEKSSASTRHANGRGFSVTTVSEGTRLARWMTYNRPDGILRRRVGGVIRHGKYAGMTRIEACRAIALHHARQLADIANGKK